MASGFVNGRDWDFTSIELKVGTRVFPCTSVNYDDPREIGKLFGNSGVKRGRTRGQVDPTGGFEMFKSDATDLLEYLTELYGGYYEGDFEFTVTFGNNNQATQTDKLTNCTLVNVSDDHGEGTDALVEGFEMDVITILRGKARAFKVAT